MKAVIINEFGGPEQLIYTDVAKPTPRDNEILVAMRSSAWASPTT